MCRFHLFASSWAYDKNGCIEGNKDFFFAIMEVRVIILASQMYERKVC